MMMTGINSCSPINSCVGSAIYRVRSKAVIIRPIYGKIRKVPNEAAEVKTTADLTMSTVVKTVGYKSKSSHISCLTCSPHGQIAVACADGVVIFVRQFKMN